MPDALVMQWSRLGDLLQTRVVLNRLRGEDSRARIVLCVDRRYASLARSFVEVSDVWPVDLARWSTLARHQTHHGELLGELERLCRSFSGDHVDIACVMSPSLSAVILAERFRPVQMHGYTRAGGELAVPSALREIERRMREGRPLAFHLADVWAAWIGRPSNQTWLPPIVWGTRPAYESEDDLHVGWICDAGESYREVPQSWAANVLRGIAGRVRCRIELYGRDHARDDELTRLAREMPDRLTDLRGLTDLPTLAGHLTAQNVVVGPDTGALHLAAALGTRVVGLYHGGAVCSLTGPYAAHAFVLQDPDWDDITAEAVAGCVTDEEAASAAENWPDGVRLWRPTLDEWGVAFVRVGSGDQGGRRLAALRREFAESVLGLPAQESAQDHCLSADSPRLSIIIPEHGGEHYTEDLLSDLAADDFLTDVELLVVSSGGSRLTPPGGPSSLPVRWIAEVSDLSFAQACNRGARSARGKFLLFLNNDTRIAPAQLSELLRHAAGDRIVSPLIAYPDGLVQNAGVAVQRGTIEEIGHATTGDKVRFEPPDALSAVAMLIHRDLFRRLEGFDESYVNGYEDLDLCLRARWQGVGCEVTRDARVTHFRGSTDGRFRHDEINHRLFTERWQRELPPSLQKASPVGGEKCAPLLIISEEPVNAAGSCLRWIWPLERTALSLGRDFAWWIAQDAASHPSDFRRALAAAQAIIVFRPLLHDSLQRAILEAVRRRGMSLLVDSDDLFLDRFDTRSARGRARLTVEREFRGILGQADLITVSTEILRESLSRAGFEARVLPTLPSRHQRAESRRERPHTSHFVLGFLGSPAHLVDLGGVLPAIEIVLDRHTDVQFFWWGCRPGELTRHPQVRQGGPLVADYATHLSRLQSFPADAAIVPLMNTPSSRARSPVKYYEYALAGIPAVYSKVTPYADIIEHRCTGLLADESTASWVEQLDCVIEDQALRTRIAMQARAEVELWIDDPEPTGLYKTAVSRLLEPTPQEANRVASRCT
jgi:GT2 family glycosyltransferase/ADP-heptose:LPS heptosyltransferase